MIINYWDHALSPDKGVRLRVGLLERQELRLPAAAHAVHNTVT
jgi:hypothetical protein